MPLFRKKNFSRIFLILVSVGVLALFLWNVVAFFNQLKKEERHKMQIWVQAYTELQRGDEDFDPILLSIIQKNSTTPMILFSVEDNTYEGRNFDLNKKMSQSELKILASNFEQQYEPIEVKNKGKLKSVIFYGNSDFINKTKYFPVVVVVVVLLFLLILYYFYSISKQNEQNKLWAGMAKETAHQIGTPLSSLVGWTEILKTEEVDPEYVTEMNKDIERLKMITERFSKIGSVPNLEKMDLVLAVDQSYEYLKNRSSKLLQFSIEKPEHPIWVMLNEKLLSWTIENLFKNAVDATKGEGKINLKITEDYKWAYLLVSDTGKGIPKSKFKQVFKPGETSKKRGWGLGLSLAKRIVEQYHDGRIRVLRSQLGQGTTFEIKLKKI